MTDETDPIPMLDAAIERYRARAEALNEAMLPGAKVPLEDTLRAALVGLPVTFEELRPMLKMTHDAAIGRVIEQDPGVILDVYAQGLLFGYYLAQEEALSGCATSATSCGPPNAPQRVTAVDGRGFCVWCQGGPADDCRYETSVEPPDAITLVPVPGPGDTPREWVRLCGLDDEWPDAIRYERVRAVEQIDGECIYYPVAENRR